MNYTKLRNKAWWRNLTFEEQVAYVEDKMVEKGKVFIDVNEIERRILAQNMFRR